MNLRQAIQQAALRGQELYSKLAVVKEIDGNVIVCSPVDGSADIHTVMLSTSESAVITFHPAIDSTVLITFLDNTVAYVTAFGECDTMSVKADTSVTGDVSIKGKLSVSSGGDSLKSIIADLISAVERITVAVPSAPGTSGPPVNMPEFELIKGRLNTVMHDN
jgi:hypothetical protein